MFKSTFLVYRRLPTINVCGKHSIQTETNSIIKQVQEVKIPVPWGHVAGKWWGPTNVKPLLGLHGWQDNAGTWDRLAPMLPSGVSLLAIDSPGHGFSSHFPHGHPYHLIDQMMVIRRIVTYYKWDKISLLSHSMGAIQSFIYTSIYPDQVENLIAVDAFKPLSVDPYTEIQKIGSQLDMFLEIDGRDESIKPSYTYDEMVEKLYHGMVSNSLTKESCKVLLKRGMLQSEHGYYFSRDVRLKVGRLTGWVQEFILEQASRIRCNVLFIKAKPGLVFEKAQINKEVLDVVKKSANIFEYHVVEGLHHVHLNDPEKVAPIINNFLNGSGYVLDLAMTSGY